MDSNFPVPYEIGSGFGLWPSWAGRPSARRYHPRSRRPRQTDRAVAASQGVIVHRRMKAPTLLAVARHRGTGSSNPFPSSGQSVSRGIFPSYVENPAFPAGVRAEQAAWSRETGVARSYGADGRQYRCRAEFQYRSVDEGDGLTRRIGQRPSRARYADCARQAVRSGRLKVEAEQRQLLVASGRRECTSSLPNIDEAVI